jgi:mitochondrial fission protein ELM1
MQEKPLIIWLLTDKKRGHQSQSLGLVNAIKELTPSESYLIDIINVRLIDLIIKRFPAGEGLPLPDLLVGAGRKSQLGLLVAKRCFGGATVCLMKPSWPTMFFDLCVIPQHDLPAYSKKIFHTIGVLNNLSPVGATHSLRGIILIGGPSKHYNWDNEKFIAQISDIVRSNQQISWCITDSPRTPSDLTIKLKHHTQLRAFYRPFNTTEDNWLQGYLPRCRQIWVSEDSVSMIYEALSTDAEVGLISVPKRRESRVTQISKDLIASGLVMSPNNTNRPKKIQLNEAKRTASFIVNDWMKNDV